MHRRGSGLQLAPLWLCLVALALVGVACARRDQAGVEQQFEADAQRRIYLGLAQPLIDGDRRLLDALPTAHTRTMAFALDASGATPLATAPAAADACREEVALFFSVERPDETAVYLLDPRSMRLERVADGACAIHRGVLVGKALGIRDSALEVFRFDFTIAGAAVSPLRCARLTDDGGNALPVAVPGQRSVVFMHRLDDQHARLMRLDEDGGAPRPLLIEQPFDARHLRADGDGVVFAANPDGIYRMYRCPLASGVMTPWDGAMPVGEVQASVTFVLGAEGLTPQVAEVPRQLTLQAVAALVEARNPAVVRRRALLAAALIEAHQLRLANLPTLSLGAFYTPVVGVFTDPVGFSGDYLAEGVVRGLIGVMQPLLEWDRNHALSEAGMVRATIARDALAEELNRQQADAALAFVACQAAQERLARDRELLALTERAANSYALQLAAGHAGSDQRYAVEQERVACQADHDSDERWLRVLLDRLKGQCGLAASCACVPVAPSNWEDATVDEYPALLRVALLNHPRLSAAHAALREAFFAGQAGSRYRPSLTASAGYAISARHGSDPIDDFVSLGLSGNLPVAWFRDRDLQADYVGQIDAALRAAEEAAALEIRRDLADSYASFHQARGALATQRAQVRVTQEQLRIARLRAEHGQPGIAAPLTVAGLIAMERETLLAQRVEAERWREVGERYIRIVESEGLANSLWRTAPATARVSPPSPSEVQP